MPTSMFALLKGLIGVGKGLIDFGLDGLGFLVQVHQLPDEGYSASYPSAPYPCFASSREFFTYDQISPW